MRATGLATGAMRLPHRRWRVLAGDRDVEALLVRQLGCAPLLARLLVNRGITSPDHASTFLNPSFDTLADPFLLPDAECAIKRIRTALHRHERVCVHGDYDVDGVTSAALWTRLLEKLGADVSVHIPHRTRDGYDMRSKFITQSHADGVKLVITTDSGTQRIGEVAQARAAGIDVVVTDHHEPGDRLPDAVAVVNPQRRDSRYPFRELAGVGVAFRLGEALIRALGHSADSYRHAYSDLAAIGTVADIMRLAGENRAIVCQGLSALRTTRKPGLQALMRTARVRSDSVSARVIGFVLGPRLNAIGRMDDARLALELLLTRDAAEANALAQSLESANTQRQLEQGRILEAAAAQVDTMDLAESGCLVLASDAWHPGIIGIVANKLVERYHRPAVLISLDLESGIGHGSARSTRPFDMFRAVSACDSLLEEFGGHSHAAGLSIRHENIAAFATSMCRLASEWLTPDDFIPVIDADAEIDASAVTEELVVALGALEPYGRGNEEPILISRNAVIADVVRMGKEGAHLKLRVSGDGAGAIDAVMWGEGAMAERIAPGERYDLCYRPSLNRYNGRTSVQFILEDLRVSESR